MRLFFLILLLLTSTGQAIAANQPPVCAEPFCTYAPPKLTGDGMAAAVREIISTPHEVHSDSFLGGHRGADRISLETFLNDRKDFHFLSPYYVAKTKADPNLIKLIGKTCVSNLTTVYTQGGIDDQASLGPVFLYRLQPSRTSSQDLIVALVYGFAASYQVRGMSYADRVASEQSWGYFSIFKPNSGCKDAPHFQVLGRGCKKCVAAIYPSFFGVGYYKDKPLIYELVSLTSSKEAKPYYSFSWHIGFTKQNHRVHFESSGSTAITDFPSGFNPIDIVNRHDALR
jgi:hypothetical protein